MQNKEFCEKSVSKIYNGKRYLNCSVNGKACSKKRFCWSQLGDVHTADWKQCPLLEKNKTEEKKKKAPKKQVEKQPVLEVLDSASPLFSEISTEETVEKDSCAECTIEIEEKESEE